MIQRVLFAILSYFFLESYSHWGPDMHFYSLVGIFLFLNTGYDFFVQLGKGIPIKQLILLIALLQWVVAPFFSYHYYTDSISAYMQVPEEQYMSFVVPGILFYIAGLFIPFSVHLPSFYAEKIAEFRRFSSNVIQRGKFLFWLGLICLILTPYVPGLLSFAFLLLSNLLFIGAFYLYAAKVRFRILYLIAAYLPVVFKAIGTSMFHTLLLWGGFLFIVYALLRQIGFFGKTIILLSGVVLILFIQLIKQEYRTEIWGQEVARTEALSEVAVQKLSSDVDEDDYFQVLVDRLNQGWIIARIMYVVPTFEPFADGETIATGLKAAIVPRVFNPDKVEGGGVYFERFTGLELLGDTSMNLGLIGEAYANFGETGGMWFMFFIGLFLNLILAIIYSYSNRFPELLLWIPFLFLYVIKAEDDFTTMINQLTKASYVLLGVLWLMSKLFPKLYYSSNKIGN